MQNLPPGSVGSLFSGSSCLPSRRRPMLTTAQVNEVKGRCCGSHSSSVTRKPAAATTATITSAIGTLILNAHRQFNIVGEQAAHQWASHRRDPKHRAQDALVVAAVPQRNDLTDQRTAGDAHRADR